MSQDSSRRKKSQTRRSALLESALGYADQGVSVFPVHSIDRSGHCTCGKAKCDSPGKHPATRAGHKEATTDSDQIRRWWSTDTWNIGAVPGYAGFAVLDIDPWKEGEADRLDEVKRNHGELPPTFTVLTGEHGEDRGRHLWYRASKGASLPRKTDGIDLRSGESYVLMPPSLHYSGIEYEVEAGDLSNVPRAPQWILGAGSEVQPARLESQARTGIKLGKRTKAALESNILPSPKEGESHRDIAVGIARNLHEAGTPAEVVLSLMTKMLENPESNLDPANVWEAKHAESIVRSVVGKSAPDSAKFAKVGRPFVLDISTLDDARELARMPIDWVIPGVLAKGDKALIAGAPKAYKTWLALHIARCVACAEPLFGHSSWTPDKPLGVLLVQEEGSAQHWGRRLESVFGPDAQYPVYYSHKSGLNLLDEAHVDALIAEAQALDIGLIVIDPFQRVTAGVNENDAADTGPVWDSIHRIAKETGAATLIVHHSRKHDGDPTMDSIRGSSRMAGEVDFMIIQKKCGPGELEAYVDGRDLVLEEDTNHLYINFDKDEPHKMKLLEMRILPLERAGTIGELAFAVIEASEDWLSTDQIGVAVAPNLGKKPSSQAVTNALHKLVEEGKAVKKRGPRNKLLWQHLL